MEEHLLASRTSRFFAGFIDGIIISICFEFASPLMQHALFSIIFFLRKLDLIPQNTILFILFVQQFFICALFALCNFYFLKKSGQTMGKKILKIQTLTLDGKIPSLFQSLVVGELFFMTLPVVIFTVAVTFDNVAANYLLIALFIIPLVDFLRIFAKDKRCFHDRLAGTMVCYYNPIIETLPNEDKDFLASKMKAFQDGKVNGKN